MERLASLAFLTLSKQTQGILLNTKLQLINVHKPDSIMGAYYGTTRAHKTGHAQILEALNYKLHEYTHAVITQGFSNTHESNKNN
ncbi:MAG: hypothetical protein ABJG41_13365 [Cyclobacteriaceae bacterium]